MPAYDCLRATWFAAAARRGQEKSPGCGQRGASGWGVPGSVGLQGDAVFLEDGSDRAVLLQLGQGAGQGGGKVG